MDAGDDTKPWISELRETGALRDDGTLNEAESQAEKERITVSVEPLLQAGPACSHIPDRDIQRRVVEHLHDERWRQVPPCEVRRH